MNIKKHSLTLIFALLLPLGTIYAQDLDSRAGDEQALLDLYNFTNGDNWYDRTGWDGETVSLENEMAGITVAIRGGELRVTAIDMQKVTTNADNETLGNNLRGTLPSSIGNLKYVEKLNVKQNKLSGEMPSEIGNMTSLKRLSLGGQQCELDLDNITEWYEARHTGRCNSVGGGKRFEETNEFSGPLPSEWSNLKNIELIEIRRQYLTGTLPESWGSLSTLRALFLNDSKGDGSNLIGGEIPESWGGMVSMQWFQLSNYAGEARFTGSFPQSAQDNWSNLNHIKIDNNELSGPLPEFPNSKNLKYVRLADNNFTGEFPYSYFNGNNSNIDLFSITNNNLTGTIEEVPSPSYPKSKNSYNPAAFHISGNSFEGPLPEWIQRNRRNVQFQIRGNNFKGSFPIIAAEQQNLRLFWIDWNDFTGELPDVSWNSNKVTQITINGNNLEGPIPESWGSIIYNHLDENGDFTGRFYRFEAKNMDLSGPIPEWIYDVPQWGPGATASLRRFMIQNNRFTFRDLLPTHEYLKSNLGEGYVVAPQKPFGSKTERVISAGETLVMDLSDFEYEGNKYQWFKDKEKISGATSSVLTIENVSIRDEGEYTLKVSNPALPELGTHSSEPITIEISEDDGSFGNNSLQPPIPKSPSDKSNGVPHTPTFNWSNVNADYYILQINEQNNPGIQIDVSVEDSSYVLEPSFKLDGEVIYQWRVRGVRNENIGDWSEIQTFTTKADSNDETEFIVRAPDLLAPKDDEEVLKENLIFKWSSVDADEYVLHITRENSSGSHEEFFYSDKDNVTITDTTYTLPFEALPDRIHSWRVMGLKDGEKGEWSKIQQFFTQSNNQVTSVDFEAPLKTALHQNYPNPFNPSTQINFTLATEQDVTISVYDMAGRKVMDLLNSIKMPTGQHEVTFNAGNLASGIYMYRFISDKQSFTRSMTLVK